jgi:hypothetical protein
MPETRAARLASVCSSSSGVRPTITATPKRKRATMPPAPTRKASGSAEIVSGRSSPTVSMRSPTINARAVTRVGAATGRGASFMAES